jgi:hypothetical protein
MDKIVITHEDGTKEIYVKEDNAGKEIKQGEFTATATFTLRKCDECDAIISGDHKHTKEECDLTKSLRVVNG